MSAARAVSAAPARSRLLPLDVLRVGERRTAHAPAARRALGARRRDRHRGDGRRARHLRIQQSGPRCRAQPARHQPADGRARPDLPRSERAAARIGGPRGSATCERAQRRGGDGRRHGDGTAQPATSKPPKRAGITVEAADLGLLSTLGGKVVRGRFLDAANERYPIVVLGAVAAQRLGVDALTLNGRRSAGLPRRHVVHGRRRARHRCRSRRRSTAPR